MNEYEFTLTGTTPLLMHADDVESSDVLDAWRKDPDNKPLQVKGDDRSPAWTWQHYLYHDGENLMMPVLNLAAALRAAGSKVSGKGKSTFKAISQSGIWWDTDHCEFKVGGKTIGLASILAFHDEPFATHVAASRNLGFNLHMKRAKIGNGRGATKHVRVRPKFDHWTVNGKFEVTEAALTSDVLSQLFDIAGRLVGLGDWRPGSPSSPGRFGMFGSKVTALNGYKAE